jgi:hypothetical protein
MKHNIIISIGLLSGAFILSQPKAIAQDQITKELLTRELGVWFAESTNTEGEKMNHYSWYGYVDELELGRGVHFNVNAETKKLISSLHVYTTVNKSGKQTESLFFNSNGDVGTAVGLINGNKSIIRIQGVNTNNIIFSGTIKKELSEDGLKSHETWNELIINGNYVESTPKRENRKLVDTNLMSLFQNGEITSPVEKETVDFLKPLEKLIGRWELKNEKNNVTFKFQWRLSAMGSLLVEKYDSINEKSEITGGGIRITGIDPSNGRLTMWSVGKNGFQRRGGWDFISDKVTGQRENNTRLIRTFEDDNTITAYWQSKKNGEYTGENNKFTFKRVVETE